MFNRIVRFAFAALLGAVLPASAMAQTPPEQRTREARASSERANANTVTVISGTVSGSFIQIANDLSFVLDDGDNLRVLPIIGKGAQQNLYDILRLKGLDIGIVRSDGLEEIKKDPAFRGAERDIAYIMKLFNDEAHLIAGKDITDIRQLAGKRVNFDLLGSGANYSGRLIFERLGIPVEALNVDQPASYEMLRKGEIAATFQMAAKPISAVAKLDLGPGFHLVDVPYDPKIADLYLPATITKADYPKLVDKDSVNTVTVSSILAVFNWQKGTDRYRKVDRFVDALFTKLAEFQKPPRHPKWTEVNLAAEVPGWQRFRAAQEWLDRNGATAESKETFEKFLQARGGRTVTADQREQLFRDFVEWRRRQTR
jgi:uncharacterized protein